MKTLLLRLVGPMQSYGTQSRYELRETNLEPSKSAVIGLLYSALGKKRDEEEVDEPEKPSLKRLLQLRMGVRIDSAGVLLMDYHTVGGAPPTKKKKRIYLASGRASDKSKISYRYYLSDASFLVGLEHYDENFLNLLNGALQRPKQHIFLGRKSFIPSEPVWVEDGIQNESLDEALRFDKWIGRSAYAFNKDSAFIRVIETDSADPEAIVRQDVPLSFAARSFTIRYIKTDFINLKKGGKTNGNLSDEDNS